MNGLAGIAAVAWVIFVIGIPIFVLVMLYRMTKALELIARHLLEIARDHKASLRRSDETKD